MSNKWYKKGSELLGEIEETNLPKELCSLWYIGQMGMILKWKGIVLCIDPVLGAMPGEDGEDRRNYPIPFCRRSFGQIMYSAPMIMEIICTRKPW